MGIRGPKPSGPGGTLLLTKKGYVRRWSAAAKRHMMEHVLVWTAANGEIPAGMQVHHINEDKTDNRLENLRLMTPLEHKREHSGCYKDEAGEWIKPCRGCGAHKNIETGFYPRSSGPNSECRQCTIARSIHDKRVRRARERKAAA